MEETLTEEKVIEGVDSSPSQMVDYNPDNMISILVYKSYDHIINHENIPKEMIERDQWCYWEIEERDGKNQKVPRYKKPGKSPSYADVTDKSTWKNFNGVHGSVSFSVNGIGPGFMLSEDDQYCLIDIDHCLIFNKDDLTWTIKPWAAEIVTKFNSYTEISSSGEGIHIIIKAKLDDKGRKRGTFDEEGHKIEIYDKTHMIALTGWTPDNFRRDIRDCQNEAIELQSKIIETGTNNPDNPNLGKSPTFEDEEIIELGLHEKTDKFRKLFKEGDYSDYDYSSQSEADQALCNKIAFYTQDPEQIDRIFRESALIRAKWIDRDDYRTYTINKSINILTATYQGPTHEDEQTKKPLYALISVVEDLLNTEDNARLIYTSLDEPYLWIKVKDHFEMIKLNSKNKALKMLLFGLVQERYGIILKDDEIFKNALLAIEYAAKKTTEEKGFNLYPPELGYRCTWYKGSAWIDLCGSKGKGIKINQDGFIKSDLPPVFLRTNTQKEQVEPNYKATTRDFDKIFKYINVESNAEKLLIKSWICAAMIPRLNNRSLSQPWLSFTGPTGAGKTKAAQYVKKLVDPIKGDENGSDKAPLPKDERDLAVVLNNSQVILFDNAGKKISKELSDLLCIAVTRGSKRLRKLYTDDEEALLNLSSAIIMTSIASDSLKEDLLNRMIPIELKGFDKNNKRKPESKLDQDFEKDLPDILGGAYRSISEAFGVIDQVYIEISELEETPRLMDFAAIGEALSRAWGEEKFSFVVAYNEAQGLKSAENITSSPVIDSLVNYIKNLERGKKFNYKTQSFDDFEPYTYYGPIEKLLAILLDCYNNENGHYPNSRVWPQTNKAFRDKIKETMMGIKNSGIEVIREDKQIKGNKYYTIRAINDKN